MSFIFPFILMLLGLVSGIVATYFIMDDPRRRSIERLKKLDDREDQLIQERDSINQRERFLKTRTAELETLSSGLVSRDQTLLARQKEFESKAVSYADLENENRLIRTELKNINVHNAYLEHLRNIDRAGHTTIGDQRDQLGQLYFNEVLNSARKAITTSNLPQNNQRIRNATETLRNAGVEFSPEQETVALENLKLQFEKV